MVRAYLKQRLGILALCLGWGTAAVAMTALYRLPWEPLGYGMAICLALGAVALGVDAWRFVSRHRALERAKGQLELADFPLPVPRTLLEADYQQLVDGVRRHRNQLQMEQRAKVADMQDYYTLWVHQIKTPIAAAYLLLQEQGAGSSPLAGELVKIEQYVEMVLGYLRLDSEDTDYVFASVEIDPLVRQVVRKLSRLFILSRIRVDIEETGWQVVSDRKWLAFVLEQVFTNAIKFTPPGGRVSIRREGECLVVADTGVGISPEDLPRVFERGFTGCNGRAQQKSTGIGLYLCRRVMEQLNHNVTLQAQVGAGTTVYLELGRRCTVVE